MLISKQANISIGTNCRFLSHSKFNLAGINRPCCICVKDNARLIIGDNSGFSGVSIYSANSIIIGSYVNCGVNASIWDTDFHPLYFIDRRNHNLEKIKTSPITIGDDVFVGANSIILKGVNVGDRAVIGFGSIVTEDIPSDQVWAGNPAKYIKTL